MEGSLNGKYIIFLVSILVSASFGPILIQAYHFDTLDWSFPL